MSHYHDNNHNIVARKVLKEIARNKGESFNLIKDSFVDGDEEITLMFWGFLRKAEKNLSHNRIIFCPTCNRFTFYSE